MAEHEPGTAVKKDPALWESAKRQATEQLGGKWSARAAQRAVQIYKQKGGEYSGKKPSAGENKLRKWTKQDWQTRPGTDPIAERKDGRTARYLPKEKWENLSKKEQIATDRKKLRSKEQYVDNTQAAKVRSGADYIKTSSVVASMLDELIKIAKPTMSRRMRANPALLGSHQSRNLFTRHTSQIED